MTDVLRGMENTEGESGQEVSRGEEAGDGAEPETCARCRITEREKDGRRDERGQRLFVLNNERGRVRRGQRK